jgi:phage FluMu gp28-like protein
MDDSRFKIGLWARQTGKSTACALEVVDDCVERPGTMWVLLSRGERQSRELMEKVRTFCNLYQQACEALGEAYFEGTLIKQLEVRLPNGSRAIGLPANPDTARGFSANVVLDEFAFHQDSEAIWTALYPTITRGHRVRVVSTPNGKLNRFYDLWSEAESDWSRHKVTVNDAIEAGLKIDVAELRRGISDEVAWRQEYLCEFVDEATAWLSWELIESCEDESASDWSGAGGGGDYFAGWDVARWSDLSVFVVCERVGDVLWLRVLEEYRRTPFRSQLESVRGLIRRLDIRRLCIDATGLGEMPAEQLETEWGKYRIERVKFTTDTKAVLAGDLRKTFEDRAVRIPRIEPLRRDLHSVRRGFTATGLGRFEGGYGGGHADRFWALALAIAAAGVRREVGIAVI